MAGIFRFGVKAGILGGFIHYTRTVGVWDDSEKTYKLTQETVAYVKPYALPLIKKVENELPVQIRDLPSTDDICRTLTTYWNKGVTTSIKFISNLPCITVCYINKGISYVTKEIQQMKDSEKNNQLS